MTYFEKHGKIEKGREGKRKKEKRIELTMKTGGLKIDERRQRILSILNRDGQVKVSQLSQDLGTSVVTIRSDLAALERDGYLERTSGGAVQTVNNFYHLDFRFRTQRNLQSKKEIAAGVSSLVQDGETLFINSGTTTYFTAIELKKNKNLNIVTNSLTVAVELGSVPTFRVLLLGGEINAQYSFTYGNEVLQQLRKYKADKAILSMDGVDMEAGLTTYHAEEAEVDRVMMERARQIIVAADATKFGHESFSYVGDLNKIQTWVTNEEIQAEYCDLVRQQGLDVLVC